MSLLTYFFSFFSISFILICFVGLSFAFDPSQEYSFSDSVFQTYSLIVKNYKYEIPYNILNGTITNIKIDCKSVDLTIDVESTNKGELQIHLYRNLIDSKLGNNSDDKFFVLANSTELPFTETSDIISRTLTIPFYEDTSQIKITGVNYPETSGINACRGIHNPPYSYLLPPLQQIRQGTELIDIECKQNLHLVIKSEDSSPACLTTETKSKLIERGWAKSFS